jgi:hypothetical protein
MVRLAKPGGAVAVAEPDTEHVLRYPPNPAFDRICPIFPAVFSRNGADLMIGRRVPELFRDAGLTDVGMESRTQMYPPGHSRRTVRLERVIAVKLVMMLGCGLAGRQPACGHEPANKLPGWMARPPARDGLRRDHHPRRRLAGPWCSTRLAPPRRGAPAALRSSTATATAPGPVPGILRSGQDEAGSGRDWLAVALGSRRVGGDNRSCRAGKHGRKDP